MRRIDEQYLKTPFYGSRKMAKELGISRTRAQRLMRRMGLEAIYPKPHLSRNDAAPASGYPRIYPYLLRNVAIVRPNQVWSSDITFVPMPHGWMYLTAVMDWYSRYVISWRLSNTLDGSFCLEALEEALTHGTPEVFNTDQGVQYTARAFTDRLELAGVAISMDGRGRWMDNVFVERLWRTVKYEYIYLHDDATPRALEAGLADYFPFYNDERLHAALDYLTPAVVYAAA
jgi:putative transposase